LEGNGQNICLRNKHGKELAKLAVQEYRQKSEGTGWKNGKNQLFRKSIRTNAIIYFKQSFSSALRRELPT
jgi:hypothetical protein